MARAWLSMLVFFDVVFVTLALWTFEPVMTEYGARTVRPDGTVLMRLCSGQRPLVIVRRDVRRTRRHAHRRRAVRVDDGAGAEDLLLPCAVVVGDVPRGASCGIASVLFSGERGGEADLRSPAAEDRRRLRRDRADHRAALGAQGVGRLVVSGTRKLTSALVLWLIFVAYLLLRRFGGPGSEKLAAAWRSSAWQRPVRLLVGQLVAHASPEDRRGADAGAGHARPFWFCVAAFLGARRC